MNVWCCDITRHQVGTDTIMVGAAPCGCQGCRAHAETARVRATVDRLTAALKWIADDDTTNIEASIYAREAVRHEQVRAAEQSPTR